MTLPDDHPLEGGAKRWFSLTTPIADPPGSAKNTIAKSGEFGDRATPRPLTHF